MRVTPSAHASLSTNEPPIEPPIIKTTSKKVKKQEVTFSQFLEDCILKNERALPETASVYKYAESVGLPDEMVNVCWAEFKNKHLATEKKYADWRAAFANCVRGNWLKLWYVKDGAICWSTTGELAKRAAA
jgi:hypothetical protein